MGSIPTLQRPFGMLGYLYRRGVLLKDFAAWSRELTERVRSHGHSLAAAAGRTVRYLQSSTERKEAVVRAVIEREGIKEGLAGVWSAVEPCRTFFLHKDREKKHLKLESGFGKCLHHYFYFVHQIFGLLHLRLQTWFPFTVTIGLNGHEWMARQMDAEGLGYRRVENAFLWLEDPAAAQALADAQHKSDWAALLEGLLKQCHPLAVTELCEPIGQRYYWSLKESEFSTDVLFDSPASLASLYPRLLRFGMEHFGSRDILRFLGKRVPAQGVNGKFRGELNTSLQQRTEGVRIKHYAAGNNLKMYDKHGSVLRVETTINEPKEFRVYRKGGKDGTAAWRPMRKAVADLHRRAQVSRAANQRYLKACAAVPLEERTGEVADTIFRPVVREGRRYRALNPWGAQDARLLEVINDGAWKLNGFRNRDLRATLEKGKCLTPAARKSQAARVTRRLRLLRAHGLIKKIPKTHRYLLTERGQQIVSALQTARTTSLNQLLEIAA